MGIVEVRGGGILSAFKNVQVYSVADKQFSRYFGFTVDEIGKIILEEKFFQDDELRHYKGYTLDEVEESIPEEEILKDVLKHYNGYTVGSQKVISPCSFMKWLKGEKFRSHWIASSGVETLFSVSAPHATTVLQNFLNLTVEESYKHKISELTAVVDYSNENCSEDSIIHFLIHSGYLTYEENTLLLFLMKSSVLIGRQR